MDPGDMWNACCESLTNAWKKLVLRLVDRFVVGQQTSSYCGTKGAAPVKMPRTQLRCTASGLAAPHIVLNWDLRRNMTMLPGQYLRLRTNDDDRCPSQRVVSTPRGHVAT